MGLQQLQQSQAERRLQAVLAIRLMRGLLWAVQVVDQRGRRLHHFVSWILPLQHHLPHSALGYRSTEPFEAEHVPHATCLPAACHRSSLQHRGRSAKSSGNTERFPRTLKEELVWLDEWISPAASSVAGRAARATSDIWHSALRYPLARGLRKGRLNRIGSVTITE
jgi:hypothetical protein